MDYRIINFPFIKPENLKGLLLKFLFILLGLGFLKTHAQTLDSLDIFTGINLHQDPKIYWVLDRRREFGKKLINSNIGYRLLLYSGTKRQDAYQIQTYFRQLYPNLETYISFSFPNFKLFGGDFRSREDAEKVSSHLRTVLLINPLLNPQKIDLNKVYTGN